MPLFRVLDPHTRRGRARFELVAGCRSAGREDDLNQPGPGECERRGRVSGQCDDAELAPVGVPKARPLLLVTARRCAAGEQEYRPGLHADLFRRRCR